MSTWLKRGGGLKRSLGLIEFSHARKQLQTARRASVCRLISVSSNKSCVKSAFWTRRRAVSIATFRPMSGIVDKLSNLVVGDQSAKMSSKEEIFVGSIDQGTTSTRFLIFDKAGEPVAIHQEEFKQIYPNPGYV